MPLTVNDLRTFTGTHALRTDAFGDNVESVNKWQRFKSFFDLGGARDQNARTLLVIREAIRNDPKFFAQDVQDRADVLIASVRTDRAIGVAQIKGIIAQLDAMSGDAERFGAARQIATGHLATRTVPDFAQGFQQMYKQLAIETVTRFEPETGFGSVDFGHRLDEFDATLRAVCNLIGDDPTARDVLAEVVTKNKAFRDAGRSGIRAPEKLAETVTNLRAALEEGAEAGRLHGDMFRQIVEDSVRGLEHPYPAGTVTKIVNMAQAFSRSGLNALNADSSAEDIHAAFLEIYNACNTIDLSGAKIEGAGDRLPIQTLFANCVFASIPDAAKPRVLAALESPTGTNLYAFYSDQSHTTDEAHKMPTYFQSAVSILKKSLGLPKPPDHPVIPLPDFSRIPLSLLSRYSVAPAISGNAGGPVKKMIDKFQEDHTVDAASDFRAMVNDAGKAQMVVNVAEQLARDPDFRGEDSSFSKDLPRSLEITLPDGSKLPTQDYNAARNKLVQFITGDPKAEFAKADKGIRGQACLLMSLMNQSVQGIVLTSFAHPFGADPAGITRAVSINTPPNTGRIDHYSISKNDAGDISIHLNSRLKLSFFMHANPNGTFDSVPLDDSSYCDCEVDMTLPRHDLDTIPNAPEWATYKHSDTERYDHEHPLDLAGSAGKVPAGISFTGDINIATHMHFVKPQGA